MASPHVAIPQHHHGNPKQYYPNNNNNSPTHHPGTSPGSSTSPRSSAGSQQFYPQSSVNFRPTGSPTAGVLGSPQNSSIGGSVGGHRPPSAQSAGYRLAQGLEDADGYLEPRSSAGSYQLQQAARMPNKEHDSGVDIDNLRDSHHHDNERSSGSDQSSKSVNFHPSGAIGWSANDPSQQKDMTKNVRPDSLAYRHDYEELPPKCASAKEKYGYADIDESQQSNLSVPNHSGSGGFSQGPSDENLPNQAYRRRQNPLYDAVVREDSKVSGKSSSGGCNRCLCVSIVLLTILCLLAVILACLAISGVANTSQDARTVYMLSTPSYAQLEQANDRIADLESKYQGLMDKYLALQDMIGINDTVNTTLRQQITHQGSLLADLVNVSVSHKDTMTHVEGQVQKLQNDTQTQSNQLHNKLNELAVNLNYQNSTIADLQENMVAMESLDVTVMQNKLTDHGHQLSNLTLTLSQVQQRFGSFRTEIREVANNISKSPGPMGPSGAGNLSLCEHKRTSKGFGIGTSSFSTAWVPSSSDHQRYVILGVECTTNTQYQQMNSQTTAGFDQYSCACSGNSVPNHDINRHCVMDYWRCPRIS